MSIQSKTLIITSLILSIALVISTMVSDVIFDQQFTALEISRAMANVHRAVNVYTVENDYIDSKLSDWSIWDDTYAFIADTTDETFIRSNLTAESLANLHINTMLFMDETGAVRHTVGVDTTESVLATVSASLVRDIEVHSDMFLALRSASDSVKGTMLVDGKPVQMAARPILRSDGSGPTRGVLMFIRTIDDEVIQKLSDTTELSIRVNGMGDAPERNLDAVLPQLNAGGFAVHEEDEKTLYGYALIKDIFGNNAITLTLDIRRDIYAQKERTRVVNDIFTVFIGFVFLGIIVILLNMLVLRPLAQLDADVGVIAQKRDMSRRLAIRGSRDEINRVAASVNTLLDAISESEIKLLAERETLKTRNADLEQTKRAMMNVLEDARELESALEKEKRSVEQKVVERTRQLEEEKARFVASVEGFIRAFVLLDSQQNVLLYNKVLKTLIGKRTGQMTLDMIAGALESVIDIKRVIRECAEKHTQYAIPETKFGSKVIELFVTPIYVNTKHIGTVLMIGDITERKIMERSKEEFFSIASHELRTPLTAIRGNASMIMDIYGGSVTDPDMREMLEDIHTSSVRLIGIVNDFLNISRLEQGKIEFKRFSFAIAPLISDSLSQLKEAALEKGIVLVFAEPAHPVRNVCADPDKVREVLINLIGNSLKYSDGGTVTVSVADVGSMVDVSVEDTGRGIALENQSLLFHKFQQAGDSLFTRDTTKGTGLGLYISKLLAEGMGGSVRLVRSELGRGSVFALRIPISKE